MRSAGRRRFDESDVVQEALVKVWTHWDKVRDVSEGERRSYIASILNTSLLAMHRQHGAKIRDAAREIQLDQLLNQSSQQLVWLADNLALAGRFQEAQEVFERLLAVRNALGLLSEEYDPVAKRLVGNFPQAFSHIGLVNTAYNLSQYQGPAEHRLQS